MRSKKLFSNEFVHENFSNVLQKERVFRKTIEVTCASECSADGGTYQCIYIYYWWYSYPTVGAGTSVPFAAVGAARFSDRRGRVIGQRNIILSSGISVKARGTWSGGRGGWSSIQILRRICFMDGRPRSHAECIRQTDGLVHSNKVIFRTVSYMNHSALVRD